MTVLYIAAGSVLLITLVSMAAFALPVRLKACACVYRSIALAGARLFVLGGLFKIRFKEKILVNGERGPVFAEPGSKRFGKSVFDPEAYRGHQRIKDKKRSVKLKKCVLRALKVDRFNAAGRLGIRERADAAVLLLGALETLAAYCCCMMPDAIKSIRFDPDFENNIFKINIECIFRIRPVKLITEAIKLKKEKQQ